MNVGDTAQRKARGVLTAHPSGRRHLWALATSRGSHLCRGQVSDLRRMRGSWPRVLSPQGPPGAPGLVLRAAASSWGQPGWPAEERGLARGGRTLGAAQRRQRRSSQCCCAHSSGAVGASPARRGHTPTSDGLSSARQGSASWLPNPRLPRRRGVVSCLGALRTGLLIALCSAEAPVHPDPPDSPSGCWTASPGSGV